jgi:photosystem II stability/assembly factor-like uncharacterized protein
MKKITAIGILLFFLFSIRGYFISSRLASGNEIVVSFQKPITAKSEAAIFAPSGINLKAKIQFVKHSHSKNPEPTEISKENEMEERNLREKWIEGMHKAAPGVNYKLLDAQSRYKYYLEQRQAMAKTSSFANGALNGQWREKGSQNQAGRMVLADVDTIDNFIYAASGGGNIWRGGMKGDNWVCLNEDLKFSDICMLRVVYTGKSKRIIVATGTNSVYYSDNEGALWKQSAGLDNAIKWGSCSKGIITNDSFGTIYLLLQEWDYTNWNSETSIYLSRNKGLSFRKLKSYKDADFIGTKRMDMWTGYNGYGNLYLQKDSNIYKISVGDSNLVFQGTIKWKSNRGNAFISGLETGSKTILYSMVDTFIYQSLDGGKTWKNTGHLNQVPYTRWSFHCSNKNQNILHIGAQDCWRSFDGGVSWSEINSWADYYGSPKDKLHADIHSIQSFKNKTGDYTIIGNDGGLYKGNDSITKVNNISLSNLGVSQYYTTYTHKLNGNVCYAGSQDQGFQRSLLDTGLMAFDQIISGDYGHIVSGDNGKSLWTVYPSFADYYPNAATSTSQYSWDLNFKNSALWMAPLMIDPTSPKKVYLGGGSNGMATAHLVTLTYDSITNLISSTEDTFDFGRGGKGKISAMAYSSLKTAYRYLMTENGAFYSTTNNGKAWTITSSFKGPSPQYFYGASIFASQKKLGSVWVAGSGYSNPPVYYSKDNGLTFNPLDSGLPHTLVYQITADTAEDFLFAATEVGPYVLNIKEGKWYSMFGSSAPDQTYWSVEYVPNLQVVRFGTYGRGIWDFKISSGITSGIASRVIITALGRLSVFPNPVKGNLHLNFNLLGNESATFVEIFDLAGRSIIRRIISNPANGTVDINVEALNKGVYFVKVSSTNQGLTSKFIIP